MNDDTEDYPPEVMVALHAVKDWAQHMAKPAKDNALGLAFCVRALRVELNHLEGLLQKHEVKR